MQKKSNNCCLSIKVFSICITALFFLSTGCRAEFSEQEKAFEVVSGKCARKVCKEEHLYFWGYGGQLNEEIKKWSISFRSANNHPVFVNEARVRVVTVAEKVLTEINRDTRVHPFLICYPFDAKHLHLSIGFFDQKGVPFKDDSVVSGHIINGRIIYSKYTGSWQPYTHIYEESYEEALEIVKKQRPDLFPVQPSEMADAKKEQ